MKFEELKNSLKQGVAHGYLLFGVDSFLLMSAYSLICKYSGLQMEDLNKIEFKEGVLDCVDIVRALNTMPVFCDKKIVYLDVRMSKQSEIKNIKSLEEYLQNPNNNSVLIINIGDNELKLPKDNLLEVDCNRLGYNIVSLKIKQLCEKKGCSVDPDAIKLLYDYTLGDLARITTEVDKLCGYVGEKLNIKKIDIESMVAPSLEYQVFELTEALSKKNSEKVYAILDDMKSKKDEYRMLPAIIFAHFRRLFMVSLNPDTSRLELSKMLGIKEYAVKMTQSQVGLFTKSALKKIIELLNQIDYDLKQSNISLDNALNLIVLQILNI